MFVVVGLVLEFEKVDGMEYAAVECRGEVLVMDGTNIVCYGWNKLAPFVCW